MNAYKGYVNSLSHHIVVGLMKMGNIVPRAWIERPPLTFQGSALYHYTTLSPLSIQSMQHLASELRAENYTRPFGMVILCMLKITYIQAMALHIHTRGRFNNHIAHSLYRIMVTATSVVGVTKMGTTVPRMGIEPKSLSFWTSVLQLHDIGSLMSPLYLTLCLFSSLPQRSGHTTIICRNKQLV